MGLQDFIRLLLPKDDKFYELMEKQAVTLHEAACVLARFQQRVPSVDDVGENVQDLEHQGDSLLHQVETALAQTFVTPIDREDIHQIASHLDDILDLTKAAAQSYVLYSLKRTTPAMNQLMDLLVESTKILRDTMPALRLTRYADIIAANHQIMQLEKNGDRSYRAAVRTLFQDPEIDAKELLREKEVLEYLERALNACEAASELLANLAVKHG